MRRVRPARWWVDRVFVPAVLLAGWLLAWILHGPAAHAGGLAAPATWFLLGALVVWPLGWLLLHNVNRWRFRKAGLDPADEIAVAWDADGVEITTPQGASRVPWAYYRNVAATDDLMVLVDRFQPGGSFLLTLAIPASATDVPLGVLAAEVRQAIGAATVPDVADRPLASV